jgi:hypothetical protein
MPFGLNNLEFLGFYSNLEIFKTVQKNYRFFVTFWNDLGSFSRTEYSHNMPDISHYHVQSITIPQYPFSKEVVKYGPIAKTYPVMNDFNGFEIDVEFEEDELGTIAYFINYLQRKIVRKDGTYTSQFDNRIDNMAILTEDDQGLPINMFWYKDIYFLNASSPTFTYSGNDAIRYTITFGSDLMKFLPIKALTKEKLKTATVSKILGV